MYEYYEPNKKLRKITRGKKKGQLKHASDCVVRAFSKAWGVDWQTAAKRLWDRGMEIQRVPDEEECWAYYLKPSGIKCIKDGHYMRVHEFAETTKNTRVKYIINCPRHLVCVSNGKYYDCWNSGLSTCRKIYIIEPWREDE